MTYKIISTLSLLLISSFAFAGKGALENLKPVLIDVELEKIYAPQGFDDNDNAQVVIDGIFPNTCYRLGPSTYKVDEETKTIYVRQQAYFYSSSWCPQVPVAYNQTLELGILPEGNYKIVTKTADGQTKTLSELPVGVSTSSNPDEFLYAPLVSAHLEKKPLEKRTARASLDSDFYSILKLDGVMNSSCMKLNNTMLLVRSNNVIEVLPVMDMDKDDCQDVRKDFTIDVSLKQITHGRYLIHIRSLNGKAFNLMADL